MPIRFILTADSQRFYEEAKDFVTSANQQSAQFVLLAGDITDFGLQWEYSLIHDILSQLKMPYLTVIGNHDLMGNGEKVFRNMFGDLNYSFVHRGLKFIFMNTNSREYRFSGKVPDINWLEKELAGEDFQDAIVISHVPPFDGDFDPGLVESYTGMLSQSGKVIMSLHGHTHSYYYSEPYNDGVMYAISDSMEKRSYLLITVDVGSFTVKRIFF